jgi:hypothetical protein
MPNRTDHQVAQHPPGLPEPSYATAPSDLYTFALAVADCPEHRRMHEEAEASYAEAGASIQRRDRLTLGLRAARSTTAVTG